ncbi:MAG: GNAT family N-acetyltransferase [Muribaculaceae bacterium]|nr:GNAT family N-acetyltransferase [Muribaculaceae bacterium]MDE6831694.1 GNAT family N-acetyltransferase [Muribaculaceae bacterium]
MKFEKITSTASPLMAQVHGLYMSAFPAKERRPWESVTQLVESGSLFFSLITATDDNGDFVGFASLWRLPDTYYIEHLAVADSCRSKGYGGKILDYAKMLAGESPLVVEVELPDANDDAPRRIAFYERHGLMAMADFEYYQPPYAPGLPDVRLMLMTTRQLPDPMRFVIMLHTLVYNQ